MWTAENRGRGDRSKRRLGMPEPFSARIPTMGFDQAYAAKAMPNHKMISDRL